MIMRTLFFVTFLSLVTVPANAQFGEILKALGLDQEEELSDDTVVSGLKEALAGRHRERCRHHGEVGWVFS